MSNNELKSKLFEFRDRLIEKGELKLNSGRDTCWFKLLQYRSNPKTHEDWMDEINASLNKSFFVKDKIKKPEPVNVLGKHMLLEENKIIDSFIRFLTIKNKVPAFPELEIFSGIKIQVIKKYFSNINVLMEKALKKDPKISEYVLNEESFTDAYFKNILSKMKSCKRFIITTAVSGKKVDTKFLASLRNLANRVNAMILILPCEDVANRRSVYQWELDPKLRDCSVICRDLYLNDNIYIDNIKVSAKQIKPLTGLDRFAQAKGSMILGSTKQDLKFVPNSNTKLPRALMTTGAVTVADYNSLDFYMSKRISKIAEFDHVLGALIVE